MNEDVTALPCTTSPTLFSATLTVGSVVAFVGMLKLTGINISSVATVVGGVTPSALALRKSQPHNLAPKSSGATSSTGATSASTGVSSIIVGITAVTKALAFSE